MNPFDSIPPQPDYGTGLQGPAAWNEWLNKYGAPAFAEWSARYFAYLAKSGFDVSITDDTRGTTTMIVSVPPYVSYRMTKSGVSVDGYIAMGTGYGNEPEAYAENQIRNVWGYAYATSGAGNPFVAGGPIGGNPPITPTQPPTVNTGGAGSGSQEAQRPANPDAGTITRNTDTAASAPELHSWDEWNYFNEQKTGRPGRDPGEAGYPFERTLPVTREVWAQYALAAPGAGSSSGTGSGSGTGTMDGGAGGSDSTGGTGEGGSGSTAAPSVWTMIGAILASVFGWANKQGA